MTNRQYIEGLLKDDFFIDDDGASYESMVHYNIACPYDSNNKDAPCYGKDYDFMTRDNCSACKMEWLEKEVSE